MLVGPVFTREVVTIPRRVRLFVTRTAYVAALLVLMCTAWLIVTGTQIVQNIGDLGSFGSILLQVLAPLQLALALLFSALLTASAVCQEKDRRTLTLLLLTDLSSFELVVGKLLASLLSILVMLVAAIPAFMIAALLGGVSFEQIACVFAVTFASAVVAGSLGSTMALWREKTFQALAMTALILVFWLATWEIVATGDLFSSWMGLSAKHWATMFSPWQAVMEAARPALPNAEFGWLGGPIRFFLIVAICVAAALNLVAILMVRVWNPKWETQPDEEGMWTSSRSRAAPSATGNGRQARGNVREVWDNPILWRELRTWAYGRKILLIRAVYLLLFIAASIVLFRMVAATAVDGGSTTASMVPDVAKPLVPMLIVSLLLVNALAVTSLTTERDGRAIDLLLVSDLTPKEFIFGKLGGVFCNSKEMIILPMCLCLFLWQNHRLSGENLGYLLGGLLVMNFFVAMLGIHYGMTYSNSRSAISISLGTVLFLFIGVATCMRMMIAFSAFQGQLQPFLAFIVGGGVGLYVALGSRNPSPAIQLAAFGTPAATFYVITSFIIEKPLSVFLVTVVTYGFGTAAMLIPAIYEFDVATGRTTADP